MQSGVFCHKEFVGEICNSCLVPDMVDTKKGDKI